MKTQLTDTNVGELINKAMENKRTVFIGGSKLLNSMFASFAIGGQALSQHKELLNSPSRERDIKIMVLAQSMIYSFRDLKQLITAVPTERIEEFGLLIHKHGSIKKAFEVFN